MTDSPPMPPADDVHRRARSAQRRRLQLTWTAVLVAVVIGAVVGFLDGRHGGRPAGNSPSTTFEAFTTGLSAAGVVLILGVFVWAWHTGAMGRARNSPLAGVDRDERRRVMAEIRGKQPADPAHLDVSRATARAMAGRQWLVVMWVGVAFTTASQLLTDRPVVVHAFGVVAAVFLVLAAAQTLVDARRARRFLERQNRVEVDPPGSTGTGASSRSCGG